jgi:hypothetical protein
MKERPQLVAVAPVPQAEEVVAPAVVSAFNL